LSSIISMRSKCNKVDGCIHIKTLVNVHFVTLVMDKLHFFPMTMVLQAIISPLLSEISIMERLSLNHFFIIMSSNYSQRIYEKFNFETIHTFKYDEYKIDGEVVFKNTGEHKAMKVISSLL
jgi:hypothetical protein